MIETIPDFLPRGLALAAAAEWPASDWPHWHIYNDNNTYKLATRDIDRLPPACRMVFERLCAFRLDVFSEFDNAFPDALGHGAGLHWIPQNGFLNWHTDAMQHPVRKWLRRLSVSVCLSRDAKGGELRLRSGEDERQIKPVFNQLVLFSPDIEHCVDPVSNNEGRKSIACFFWDQSPAVGSTRSEFTDGHPAA